MKLYRILGVILQEYYLTLHSLEIFIDIFFYPMMTLIVFGFISVYVAGSNLVVAHNVLLGMFFWQVISVAQYSVAMLTLWNIWSRNLSNLFVTPLTVEEFLTASTLSAIIKSGIVFASATVISLLVFNFNIFIIGIDTILAVFVNLVLFAFSIAIFILALLFRFGPRIQALAWGLIALFQPLSATFFPVQILPTAIQPFAYMLPSTYAFEAARYGLAHHTIDMRSILMSFGLNIVYLLLSWWFFKIMFKKSRKSGQFARNEG